MLIYSMLTYRFMVVALIVAILLGIALPLVGSLAVYKRLSTSGEALAHSSLAGIVIGLVSGLNTLAMSIVSCIVAFLIIELLRKRFHKYAELTITVVLAVSIALIGILSGYTNTNNFQSYLFGSILLIEDSLLYVTIALVVLILLFNFIFFPQIFSSYYSESESKVSGIKVPVINFIQGVLLSLTIAIGQKVVGLFVVSSMIILPTAISLQLKKGYLFTTISSVFFSISSMVIGLVISYYLNIKPGASILLVAVSFLFMTLSYSIIRSRIYRKRRD